MVNVYQRGVEFTSVLMAAAQSARVIEMFPVVGDTGRRRPQASQLSGPLPK